jgi:hypothetical protein
MTLKVQDVITEDFVRDTVEEFVEEDLVYRDAFAQIDASSIGSNAYQFNIAQDDMGRVQVVPEGAEVPRHQTTVKEVLVTFDKYAGEISITMEAQQDGLLDMKAREVDQLARAMDERLNFEAFKTLRDNVKTSSGDDNGTMTFGDIRDGMIEVRQGDYSPDMLILDLEAYGDLLTDDNFNRATEGGDDVVATGEIGQIAGLNVIVDNRHAIGSEFGDNDGPGAFIVDTEYFGYELTRTGMDSTEYEDNERMADNVQVFTRRSWKAIFDDAAVAITG